MKLNFLFLPFVGTWDQAHTHFYVNAHRFERKWQHRYERCIECIHSVRTRSSTYKITHKHNYAAWEQWVYTCNLHKKHKKDVEFKRHPCSEYTNPYRLKKL